MKIKIFVLLSLMGLGLMTGCKEQPKKSIETSAVEFTKEGELWFVKASGDTLATFAIEVAKTPYEQHTGLMYRKSMDKDHGMLFVYPNERPRNGFYMKNTYIALDLIYINSENTIVYFNENAKPFDETPLPAPKPAQYVLEVNAGIVDRLGLELGDKVLFSIGQINQQ